MKFLRPKGAVKDFKELEYLVALLQTTHDEAESFMEGSVDAKDVRAFLLSRYGIQLTETQVQQTIFKGLTSGGGGEDEVIDILEIVTILMIPVLVKMSDDILGDESGGQKSSIDEDKERLLPPAATIEYVLRDILRDTTDGAYDVENPPPLTPSLVRKIFLEYDELDLVRDDDLIEQMIGVVSESKQDDESQKLQSEPSVLDVKTFAKALTNDINLYNPENETRYSEVYDDVFPDGLEEAKTAEDEDKEETAGETSDHPPSAARATFRTTRTFSHMDFTADSFVHVMHVVLVWLIVVFSYFWYMLGVSDLEFVVDQSDNFGRRILFAIYRWTVTMLKLVILGSAAGLLLPLGNGQFQRSLVEPISGLASIAVLVFVPYFMEMNNFVLRTDLEDPSHEHSSYSELRDMMLVFGVMLVIIQLKNLVTIIFGKGDKLKKNPAFMFMENVLGSNVRRAYRNKQAGIYKINKMVLNACYLHSMDSKAIERAELKREVTIEDSGTKNQNMQSSSKVPNEEDRELNAYGGKSSRERALQNYNDLVDDSEEVGGVVWAWKEHISGNLALTEGVNLPSRLIAANTILFVTIFALIYIVSMLFNPVIESLDGLYNLVALTEVEFNDECFSEFDYRNCYFPFETISFYTGVAVCRGVSLSGPGCGDLFEPISPESTFGTIGSAIGNICDSFEAAYAPLEKQVADMLGGASCPYVLDAAKTSIVDILAQYNYSAYDAENLYNACHHVKYIGDEDIAKYNEWFDDDTFNPDITEQTLMDCDIVSSLVNNETFVDSYRGREEAAYLGFQLCMNTYNTLTPRSFCEEPLLTPIENIITYEKNHTDTEFCYSYLSLCVVDPYNPSRATCVIGEANKRYYRFEGSTCEDYSSINNTMNHYRLYVEPTVQAYLSLFPAKWMLYVTLGVGIFPGLLAALSISLVYVPSSIHTVLKFRSGVIPSLKDPKFIDYRENLHDQTLMIGSMFWGFLHTTVITTLLTGGIVFLVVWPVTNPIVVDIVAQVIGISITVLAKMLICFIAMRTAYVGFYRTKPMFANVFCFALECWNLALTLFSVASRVAKFLVVMVFYMGRIDKPVLADGLFWSADNLPKIFRQNLLSTESHRHPYIELLGQMYLMKIRHGDDFGSRAGSMWRILFVSAMMPWLKKKRIQDKDVDIAKLKLFVESRRSVGETQDKSGPKELVDEVEEENRSGPMEHEVEEKI